MNILTGMKSNKKELLRAGAGMAVAVSLSLVSAAAFADDPTSMAPPIETSNAQGFGAAQADGINASADSVFNWNEIPANQQVPLTRASFDKGGYQLYDSVGETIVVPFTNQNLYVMKFAESANGSMYFVNEGGYPVLYVPKNGYLENATVSGAHWYPFGQNFHPAEPVFLGIAPSYDAFIDMGWYPDMRCYGGYYGRTSFLAGGLFLPSIGLFFQIGGQPYYGWGGYHRYYSDHRDFYHTDFYRHDFYDRGTYSHGPFRGYSGANHGYAGAGHFEGGGHPYYAHHSFRGAGSFTGHTGFNARPGFAGGHQGPGSGHTFRGVTGSTGSFQNSHAYSDLHKNSSQRSSSASHDFGSHQNSGSYQNSGSHQSFGGGGESGSSSRSFHGSSNSGQSGRTFGGSSVGGSRSSGGDRGRDDNSSRGNNAGGGNHDGGGNRGGGGGGSHGSR